MRPRCFEPGGRFFIAGGSLGASMSRPTVRKAVLGRHRTLLFRARIRGSHERKDLCVACRQ